jgi:hypothetical protein
MGKERQQRRNRPTGSQRLDFDIVSGKSLRLFVIARQEAFQFTLGTAVNCVDRLS